MTLAERIFREFIFWPKPGELRKAQKGNQPRSIGRQKMVKDDGQRTIAV